METKTTGYLTQTKVSKSRNGQSKSYTYSTVIPKVIVNKFELEKGKKLYWDIGDNGTIIIAPELPEEDSIQAGYDILNDMLFNNNSRYYLPALERITQTLNSTDLDTESKVNDLVTYYNNINPNTKESINGFEKVVLYLLDYPLNLTDQYEILKEVYNQITQTD